MPHPRLHRWPDHWYHDQDHIRCIVPNCGFVTPSPTVLLQWTQIHDHCIGTQGAEHEILKKMLQQTRCAIDNCDLPPLPQSVDRRIRALFAHENAAHGSADMSNICSFVRLAREGRLSSRSMPDQDCEVLAFQRMLAKVLALPDATKDLLFQKSGFHQPDQQTPETMGKILTADYLAQPGDEPPYWWPIRAEHFLWQCRPQSNNPADHHWRILWTRLREEYADGRI